MLLKWKTDGENLVFYVAIASGNVPLLPIVNKGEKLHLENGQIAKLGAIFLLLEEGKAEERLDGSIQIPFEAIAELSLKQLSEVGLPGKMPYSVEVRGNTAITEKDFQFQIELLNNDSTPVASWKRNGGILSVGRRSFVIPSPVYELFKAMEAFNLAATNLDMEEKFSIWADLKELLPDGAIKNDYLNRLEIKRAEAFTLNPYIQTDGKVNFDPVLLRQENVAKRNWSNNKKNVESLAPAAQNDFAEKFKDFAKIRPVYTLRGGVYCVVHKDLQKALKVVKDYQLKSAPERIAFARNPKVFLSEALGDLISTELIEEIFQETEGYSERVKEIGVWSPPIIPYSFKEASEWFVDSEIVLKTGDKEIHITIADLLKHQIEAQENLESGIPVIEINGHKLPVAEVVNTIDAIKKSLAPEKPLDLLTEEVSNRALTNEEVPSEKLGLNIYRNLEDEEYQLNERLSREALDYQIDNLLNNPLPHQNEAIKILQDHWRTGSPGMLMADDMGLGKTYQTLAFLSWVKMLMAKKLWQKKPFLLVAPTGLIQNWIDEQRIHVGSDGLGEILNLTGKGLAAMKTKDGLDRNAELITGFHCLDLNKLQNADWVITTYETLRDYQFSFAKINWSVLIFDEMQKIKNPKARVTDAAKAMKADFVLGLTGTPVENTLLELWCLIDTIKPGFLKSLKQFAQEYNSSDEKSYQKLSALNQMLTSSENNTPLMLRRLKSDHLKGLPSKQEHFLKEKMPISQSTEYSICQENAKREAGKKGSALEALLKIRTISLHPGLVNESHLSSANFQEQSARVLQTTEIIDMVKRKNEKALIFCETRQMQAMLAEFLKDRYDLGHIPIIINGTMPGTKRKAKVDIFQQRVGFDVMILSPKAGGVGLTLTAANHVIHLTRWWNPAVEDQCTDRVYRIGQKNEVNVYYPQAIHPSLNDSSFDIVLNTLLEKKRSLNKQTLSPTQLTEKEMEELYKKATGL